MSIKSTFRNDSIVHHYTATHYIIQLLRIIAWKKDYTKHSIMLTLLWTFFWFHTSIFAYTVPIWIILGLYNYVIEETMATTTTTTNIDKLTDELKEIQLELSLLLPSPESKDRFRRRSLFILDQSLLYQTIVLTVTYIIWISLLNIFGGQKIVWFLGSFILTWNSPLFKVIRDSCHRAQLLLFLFNKHDTTTTTTKTIKPNHNISQLSTNDHTDRFYRFLIIEHQRWWLHCGWTSLLLPNERPEWSDEYLSKVPSKTSFHLPPPTTKFDKVTQKMIKISWEWATPEWHIDENHNVDKNGWEYGTWDWTAWSTKSSGLRVLTRRRHWIRNARLVKQDITETNTITLPINIRSSTKHTTSASISTSYSSEDSFMCTTPTTTTASPSLSKSFSINTSALSLKHVEPTTTIVESSLWLRR